MGASACGDAWRHKDRGLNVRWLLCIVLFLGCKTSTSTNHCGELEYKDGAFHNPYGEVLRVMVVGVNGRGETYFRIPPAGSVSYTPYHNHQVYFYNSQGLVGFMKF